MKEDLRVRRTKNAIKNAFLNLLEQKTLDDITIMEITELAVCNRNTFYLHYEDKYDLIKTLCREVLEALFQALDQLNGRHDLYSDDLYLEITRICMEAMEADLEFYTVVMGKNRYPQFSEQYREGIVAYIFSGLNISDENMKAKKLEVEFSTNGLIGVHRYWLLHQQEYSKEEILLISKNIVLSLGKIIYEK